MNVITMVLATLVALEFVFIFYLETIATSSERTAKVFGMDVEELKRPSVDVLFKNQGVYNLLIAVLVVIAVFGFGGKIALMALMGYIVAVAAYGAITSSPKMHPHPGRPGHPDPHLLPVLAARGTKGYERRIFSRGLPLASSSTSLSSCLICRMSGSSMSCTRTPHTLPVMSSRLGFIAGALLKNSA